jgi:pyruvate kinase
MKSEMSNKKSKRISLYWRRTKIIATLGPASATSQAVEKLIKAGVNVFRLNMSHGSHNQHRSFFRLVRRTAASMNQHVAILMDLCGPKIRTGKFKSGGINLKNNSIVQISCNEKIGEKGLITSQYAKLYKDVKKGNRILLDDGNLELLVEKIIGQNISCKVIRGGTLKDNKGMNLPDSNISVSSFTAKDKKDVRLAMELGADFVA